MRRAVILALLVSCVPAAEPVTPLPPDMAAQAASGVTDRRLADLLARQWNEAMIESPVWATTLGDHRFDDRLPAHDQAALTHALAVARGFLGEATALASNAAQLSASDRETLRLFTEMLEDDVAIDESCRFDGWSIGVDSRNPISPWDDFDTLPMKTPADGRNYVARVRAIERWIDEDIALLESGAKDGLFANAESVRRTLAMVDRQIGGATAEWPIAGPLKSPRAGWPPADKQRFDADLTRAIDASIRPALVRWRDAVKNDVLPHARDGAYAGLSGLPGGGKCYAALIKSHTSLPLTAEELHARGLADVARDDARIRELGKKLFGTDDLAVIVAKLRDDPALRFASADEIEAKANHSLAAAKSKIPLFFGVLPKADCIVKRIPDASAPFTTIAYYERPHADGSEPGHYMINVHQPTTRSKYEAAVLAYHESIPGHHLQIAIASELPAAPLFRRHLGTTAFIEGWGLYSERLSEEMGLYEDDLDRMGVLSFDAWRASRLVVDTGLHAKGWTREQAIDFMKTHTALAETNIQNEVDRYLVTPGQALAYKVGQEQILALRKKAEDALGPKFKLPAFHDAVLGGGAVTLPVLEERIDAWIASQQGR